MSIPLYILSMDLAVSMVAAVSSLSSSQTVNHIVAAFMALDAAICVPMYRTGNAAT